MNRFMTATACAAMIGVGLFSAPAAAQSLSFFGDIGGAPVFVSLERAGDKLTGWYLYLQQAKQIRLAGAIDASGFTMDESSFENGKKTGSFKGLPGEAAWSGMWRSPDGRQLKLTLRRARDALSDLSGRFRCKARASESGYSFVSSLDFSAAKGRVTQLSLSHEATSEHDEQSCSVALSDLTQIPTDSGILLRAKDDDGTDTNEGAQHCTLHVRGDSGALIIEVAGCMSAGGAMLCSARGSWSDLVLNRKTQTCKAIE